MCIKIIFFSWFQTYKTGLCIKICLLPILKRWDAIFISKNMICLSNYRISPCIPELSWAVLTSERSLCVFMETRVKGKGLQGCDISKRSFPFHSLLYLVKLPRGLLYDSNSHQRDHFLSIPFGALSSYQEACCMTQIHIKEIISFPSLLVPCQVTKRPVVWLKYTSKRSFPFHPLLYLVKLPRDLLYDSNTHQRDHFLSIPFGALSSYQEAFCMTQIHINHGI